MFLFLTFFFYYFLIFSLPFSLFIPSPPSNYHTVVNIIIKSRRLNLNEFKSLSPGYIQTGSMKTDYKLWFSNLTYITFKSADLLGRYIICRRNPDKRSGRCLITLVNWEVSL